MKRYIWFGIVAVTLACGGGAAVADPLPTVYPGDTCPVPAEVVAAVRQSYRIVAGTLTPAIGLDYGTGRADGIAYEILIGERRYPILVCAYNGARALIP